MRDTWNRDGRDLWILSGPSRRLRKLYRALDALDAEIAAARTRCYCPEHAPTDWVMRRAQLRELLEPREALLKRIDLLQNGD